MAHQQNYDWIKAFSKIKELVIGYRRDQKGLITILKDAGIDVPDDEYPEKNKVPLEQIDPFSFLSLINKHPNVYRRAEFVNKILGQNILNIDIENFSGVPTSQGTAALFFPYKYHRKADDVNLLWDLFESIDDLSKITPQLFQDILSIHSVGFSKLTQGLFWYAPDLYLPIDGQTVPYLSDITFPQAYKVKNKKTYSVAWQEYKTCLNQVKKQDSKPFYKISFDAWLQNGKKYSAQQAIQYLEKRYGKPSGSTHIKIFKNSQNREMALDPSLQSAKVFVESMPQIDFFSNIDRVYGIAEKRNYHLDTYGDHLGIMHPAVLIKNLNEELLGLLCDWYDLSESGRLKERLQQFLSVWPLQSISTLKFKDYYQLKQYDSFARWIDLFDVSMGATYGNNFHVWRPLNAKKETREHTIYQYENKYAWEKAFGNTFDEAFETVKRKVNDIAQLARQGDFQSIEAIDLNDSLKWKVAFVYQNFNLPKVYPIFSKEDFKRLGYKSVVNSSSFTYMAAYGQIESDRNEKEYFEYVEQLHERILEVRTDELDKKVAEKSKFVEGEKEVNKNDHELNRILFGAAGTGKTYHTINHALAILENKEVDEINAYEKAHYRKDLKDLFEKRKSEGRIEFVTFHQSFSYEDFVEGIRAETENGNISYSVQPGIFKVICERARENKKVMKDLGVRPDAAVWKLSIGDLSTRQYCFDNNQIRVGWGQTGDLSIEETKYSDGYTQFSATDHHTLEQFTSGVEIGDVIVCLKTTSEICAVGVITGDYFFDAEHPRRVREDYLHCRNVNWILKDLTFNIRDLNGGVGLTLKTMYRLWRFTWNDLLKALNKEGYLLSSEQSDPEPYVLIIDEINRGNISRIFGELITLIEDSKREGADEPLSVKLPYSKKEFSVPKNLYIIGTMNSSDRSLTGLDIALRRRFTFIEMLPKPELLKDIRVEDLKIDRLLGIINQRIEVLLDRDHCLGHANFMTLKEKPTLKHLASIFRQKIIPQLQEYFFDDWEKIDLVLNRNGMLVKESNKKISELFPADVLEGLGYLNQKEIWKINPDAFNKIENYKSILGMQDAS
ncbi:TPA: AAA family ATPase [Acinetobacter baumannii]